MSEYRTVKTRAGRDAKILADDLAGVNGGRTIVAQIGRSVMLFRPDGFLEDMEESDYDLMLPASYREARCRVKAQFKANSLVMFSSGVFDDYAVRGTYRVLQDVSDSDLAGVVCAIENDEHPHETFIGEMVARGYLEAVAVTEIHLGSLGGVSLISATPSPVSPSGPGSGQAG